MSDLDNCCAFLCHLLPGPFPKYNKLVPSRILSLYDTCQTKLYMCFIDQLSKCMLSNGIKSLEAGLFSHHLSGSLNVKYEFKDFKNL